ncbi:translation factor GUF1, mitochondrial-like [Macrosteles quadrilineatus]|uniref:translation factor GUF1, mitochondrial-like n=1 Tax=Macrosteles quadrilineatus TaxID=74068 RepID=UPI0023E1A9F4|nr:translation factor GUF1, mitochondrial-like [Macrosteles quadrilineatus]
MKLMIFAFKTKAASNNNVIFTVIILFSSLTSTRSDTQAVGGRTIIDNKDPSKVPLKNIRNFSIIAHIDHGKSTLADRLLEVTGTLQSDPGNKQVLDRLQVERERGITVKAQTASLFYNHQGEEYLLNLIDTPGHVDFSNEVARSLAACQGVVLLVDATQGVEAQTVANFHLAFYGELTIIPVLNKIDVKNIDVQVAADQLAKLFSFDPSEILKISAKEGTGVEEVLKAVIERVPAPPGDSSAPLRALIFDSWFDKYRGPIALVYIRDGSMTLGDEVMSAHSNMTYTVKSMGILRPQEQPTKQLLKGQVGYLVCNMKSVSEAMIGDTFHLRSVPVTPLPGFKPARPMVYAGVYPMDQSQHNALRGALEKLALNDPSVTVAIESSPALGQGWRVGFLGLLHLEVFNQRLEQEYGADALMTAPSVPYKVKIKGKKNIARFKTDELLISDPSKLPDIDIITEIHEPVVKGSIITPYTYMNSLITLCTERRGSLESTSNLDNTRVSLGVRLPLNEIIVDFHDRVKSLSSGFASFDYEDAGYQISNLVKLEIMLNGEIVDALCSIVHESKAHVAGKNMCEKLKKLIPRQMVPVMIQAAVGAKIVARETINPYRKDVIAKLYGGDVSRKKKLLTKQAEGKKKMKSIAKINIPKDTFLKVLKQ